MLARGVCARRRAPGDAPSTLPATADLEAAPLVGHGGVSPRQGGVARADGDGEMVQRLHILGASGSGTTTLGRALAEGLQCPHFDTDDYFWLPTDPPFTQQ